MKVRFCSPVRSHIGYGELGRIVVHQLIQAGIDIDRQNDNGATCLMYVASNSKPDLVSLLLERGANPRLANHDDFTALDLAGSLPCLKLLRAA